MWLFNGFISYGFALLKKDKKAAVLTDPVWLASLERCRKSFGLEGVSYEYWSYPTPIPEGMFWIRGSRSVALLLSHGFLKTATETQVAAVIESLSTVNFNEYRRSNQVETVKRVVARIKGETGRYRYWLCSFFLYPLERMLWSLSRRNC